MLAADLDPWKECDDACTSRSWRDCPDEKHSNGQKAEAIGSDVQAPSGVRQIGACSHCEKDAKADQSGEDVSRFSRFLLVCHLRPNA
nr:putative integron gene cassette protein [uncultured bacterium]